MGDPVLNNDEDDLELKTSQVRDIIASQLVDDQMTIYGKDLISRQYPHVIDGLKMVQRLILWTVGTTTDLNGLNYIIGATGHLHTGGDSSIYDALVRIAQEFRVGYALIHIEGSKGSYANETAAAPRYIDARSTEFAKDVFFNRCVQNTLPMVYSKNFKTKIPEYFIPCIPTALLINHLTIGFGYKSVSPQLNLSNLCDLVMRQVEYRTKTFKHITPPDRIMAKYLIPDYPIPNYIMNREEILTEYAKGNFNVPIRLSGHLQIKDNQVVLKSCAFGTSYFKTYDKLCNELADKRSNLWLFDLLKGFQNFSSKDPKFTLSFKNNVNIFEILDKLKPMLCLEDTIHPSYHYYYGHKLVKMEPPFLLATWYDERKKSILSGVKYRHMELTLEKMEKEARLVVADNPDMVIKIIRESNNETESIANLVNEFKQLTRHQAKILASHSVGKLTKQSKTDLVMDIERIEKALDDLLNQYTNLDEIIYNDAEFIKKKFNKPRMTTFVEQQIGYINIEKTGIIQFDSPDSLYNLLDDNLVGSREISIHSYHGYLPNRMAMLNNKPLSFKYKNIPKELYSTGITEYPNNPITFCKTNDSVAVIPGLKTTKDPDTTIQYTTRKFYGIRIDGRVVEIDSKDLSNRKSISRGSKSDIIHVVPGMCKDMVVIHMHPMETNALRFDRILIDEKHMGKCITIPTTDTVIIDIQPMTNVFTAFNIPQHCVNKLGIHFVTIENIKGLFPKNEHTKTIVLNKLSGQAYSKYIKKHPTISKLLMFVFPK